MLKNIAGSLKALWNEKYLLFNTSEYRFVFYIKCYKDKKELTVFCKKIFDTLRPYLFVHGIGAAIGILQINKSLVNNTDQLLKKLMNTSEMAANKNYNNILFYNKKIDIQFARGNEISYEITEIVSGTKTDKLYLQYQPIYDITSNRICGFEALARIRNKKYGIISPLEFISIAEKTNMIVPLGELIILQALKFLQNLKENGHDIITVSINISTIQMLDDGFANRLLSMIHEMRINPENIGIELTESIFATERVEINIVISILKSAGIKVLIDDFGTGYSSFARERELNVDCIKIDKSFIDKLLELKPEESITGDIISMAHKLGHCVIAEGVEFEKQMIYLREHGCDRLQGFIISKPIDIKEAIDLLNDQNSIQKHINTTDFQKK